LIGSKDKGAKAPLSYVPLETTEDIGDSFMADNKNTGFLATLRRPSAKYSLLTLLVVGFFSGIFFWGGFNTGMEATNTLEFCIGCHEMRDNVYSTTPTARACVPCVPIVTCPRTGRTR
jgi:hypothetical protein